MKLGDNNDPTHHFFKTMATTVLTFPPELRVEAKKRVFDVISELELQPVKENEKTNINLSYVEPTTSTATPFSKLDVPTTFVEADITTTNNQNMSTLTAAQVSNYSYLQYLSDI